MFCLLRNLATPSLSVETISSYQWVQRWLPFRFLLVVGCSRAPSASCLFDLWRPFWDHVHLEVARQDPVLPGLRHLRWICGGFWLCQGQDWSYRHHLPTMPSRLFLRSWAQSRLVQGALVGPARQTVLNMTVLIHPFDPPFSTIILEWKNATNIKYHIAFLGILLGNASQDSSVRLKRKRSSFVLVWSQGWWSPPPTQGTALAKGQSNLVTL